MRRKFFIITIVMMLFAVQGYAQRHHHHHHCAPHYGYYYNPYWYTWYSYPGRYVYYSGMYFDMLLGYYIYGTMDRPSKIKIEGLTFTRKSDRLKVKNGTEPVTYLDLYRDRTMRYSYPDGRTIDVKTGDGSAEITFYDKKGNYAEYRL